jgi:hypothetical protein
LCNILQNKIVHAKVITWKKSNKYLNLIFQNSTIGSHYTTKGVHDWHGNKIINPKRQGKAIMGIKIIIIMTKWV